MEEVQKQSTSKTYRFKELKVYSSTEWLADNQKKYRQVFDRYDTSYIYAELSFVNKLYDVESWEVNVQLKCYEQASTNREICALNVQRKISKHEHISFVREGWGNKKEGVFWKKGTYFWEAYIDGSLVATKYFYVEDQGEFGIEPNETYIKVKSLKTYEGQYDDVNEDDRKYYSVYSSEETRYIYTEILLANLNVEQKWHCELFVKFYNEARELKGQVVRLNKVDEGQEYISVSAGWGSNIKGSWRYGSYTCEIIFMDRLLATVPFEVDDDYEDGYPMVKLPGEPHPKILINEETEQESFDELMSKMDRLIGLDEIKSKIRDQAKYIQFVKLRRDKGFKEEEDINVHSVFIGNPGTGKTTVARMLGKIYREMGVLTRGHVVDVDRVDLVGEYIGQTAPKVKAVLEKAAGGVLFIDEAYSLARAKDDSKDFGREVIEMLVKEMSDGARDMVVVVAGYPQEMKTFLDSNPGLKSRFKLYYEFSDYLPDELMMITEYACQDREVILSPEAKEALRQIVTNSFRDRDRSFGNARFINDLVEKAKINLGLRVMQTEDPESLSREALSMVLPSDIDGVNIAFARKRLRLPIDQSLLDEALAELDDMIGMTRIKKDIKETARLVRYHLESGKDVLNRFYLHSLFVGNPGTGKTTVARILTKIYKALGILERGHMIETDRQGLVAGYVGQTAIKTSERIDEANGGVLFIDEAYALNRKTSSMGDFGDEAVQTLLKRMEDQRGEFFVFAAGYPDNMEAFLKMNPGLSSRFDRTFQFDDYSAAELYEIAVLMLSKQDLRLGPKASEHLQKYISYIHVYRDKYFGNARVIRKLVDDLMKQQNLRLADISPEERTEVDPLLITAADVAFFETETYKSGFDKRGIGFRKASQR